MRFTESEEPLTEKQITFFEREVGLQFPLGLRWLYLRANGGCPDPCLYEDEQDASIGVMVAQCLPLGHGRETAMAVYKDQILKKALMPKHFFPFAVDPTGDYVYVDCSSERGSVYVYHHDTAFEPLIDLRVGIDDFWSRLKPDPYLPAHGDDGALH